MLIYNCYDKRYIPWHCLAVDQVQDLDGLLLDDPVAIFQLELQRGKTRHS